MSVDNSYQPSVYREQGGNKLVVKDDGEIEIFGTLTVDAGATVTGLVEAAQLPLDATDSGQITGLVDIATLALPSGDGNYQLTITSGVASWTEIT